MSSVRPEECERNKRFMPSEARQKIFLKKYKIRALQFIVLLLNCTLGPPNLGVGGGGPPGPPLDPLVRTSIPTYVGLKIIVVSSPLSLCNWKFVDWKQISITRKSSCMNVRGIPTAAYQALLMLSYPWGGGGVTYLGLGGGVPTLAGGMGGSYLGWEGYLP